MQKKSVRAILEEDPTPKNEMPFIKVKGNRWKVPNLKRSTSSVKTTYEELDRLTEGKPYSFLHSHPRLEPDTEVNDPDALEDEDLVEIYKLFPSAKSAELMDKTIKGLRDAPSFPSSQDIVHFLYSKNERFSIIAQRDPITGKVAGYYFLKKTKNTPSIPRCPEGPEVKGKDIEDWESKPQVKKVFNVIKSSQYDSVFQDPHELTDNDRNSNQNKVDDLMSKLNIKARYVPAKGYQYTPGFGFTKKESEKKKGSSKLEEAVMVAIVLAISVYLAFTNPITVGHSIVGLGTIKNEHIIFLCLLLFMLIYVTKSKPTSF